MTSEEVFRHLANDPSHPQALELLYTHNRTIIDAAIKKWFGTNAVVPHATRYVLAEIAARIKAFAPERQTPEGFVAELADEESSRLYEKMERKIIGPQ